MSTLDIPQAQRWPSWVVRLATSRWTWCLAAVLWLGCKQYFGDPLGLVKSLGDTDDATRLVQVRELIAGAPWFDTTLARLGGATPLVSHWSRLIDLPIALLLSMFGWAMSQPAAEYIVRAFWPLLVLFFLLRLVVHEAEVRVGRNGGLALIVLIVTGIITVFQFNIGRIDHHNAMILGAVGGLLMMARAFEAPRCGTPAGILLGFSFAVGYEGMAVVLPAIAMAAAAAVVEVRWLKGIRSAAVAMALTLALAVLATTAPQHWFSPRCDALGLNLVALIAAGAAGLSFIASRATGMTIAARMGTVAIAGLVGAGLYLGLEPACIGGPFAQVDPLVNPIWLDMVQETFSLWRIQTKSPAAAVVFILSSVIGIAAQLWRWRRLRTAEAGFMLVLVAGAVLPAVWQVKLMPYASWFSTFALATVLADAPAIRTLSPLSVRLSGLIFANHTTFAAIAIPVLLLFGASQAAVSGSQDADFETCRDSREVIALDRLPRGLVVADVDFGPYIVALTHHDALAAPYHRIDKAIIEADTIFKASPAEAERRLRAVKATYVYECVPKREASRDTAKPESLREFLFAGQTPAFLERIELPGAATPLRLYKMLSPGR